MWRSLAVFCALAVIAAGCGGQQLGRKIIECGLPTASASTTLILTAQAVPSADFLPCVEALRPGWQFEHVLARNDQAFFTIDSDRMGNDFLRVTLLSSCDVGAAREVESDESGATLSIEVLEERTDFVIVVVPVADRHLAYATSLAALFTGDVIKGRRVVGAVDDSDDPISVKIASAHAAGRPVVVVDDVDVDSASVSLRRVGGDEDSGLSFEGALEEIEDDVDSPLYRARWFYEFPGGCIRYDIDADGEGAQSVAFDVARAIGMYPMEELQQIARDAGYRMFE